ncbi:cyclic AMP-dependent transcription factor ATF-3-like [Haliotis cracherodii]|uniref:uncharacterized protein LOC124148482 n=1 Tax=Haliotis rufescens TaxID=6454 RepID=UPI001EB0A89C|nr:uncharacterized protein LOC124148482 [Haliotis rufescens]
MTMASSVDVHESTALTTAAFMQELGDLDDLTLVKATYAALESGRLTPLLKEELRCRIQSRRLSEGKDELMVEFTAPTKDEPRPEEVAKLDRRREQNRRAARKFREKKRNKTDVLMQETHRLEASNDTLRSEISELGKERTRLLAVLTEHAQLCHMTKVDNPPP